MKIAVVYRSKYGTTKQYAEWIAEALEASLFESRVVKPERLLDYDWVISGGGLYAGGISGIGLVTKHPCNRLVIFTVGLASPEETDYSEILAKNIPAEMQVKIFHLRGGIDYQKLGIVHKGMMAMLKKFMLDKKDPATFTADDKAMLESYGGKVNFTDQQTIRPLVDYVKNEVGEQAAQ